MAVSPSSYPVEAPLQENALRASFVETVEAKTVEDTPMGTSSVPALIDFYSEKYHLSPFQHKLMYDTVRCESQFVVDTQSFAINPVTGEREDSWGLVQIHLPDHPSISKEQAINPDFALDFMASHFAKQNYTPWTCARNILNGSEES